MVSFRFGFPQLGVEILRKSFKALSVCHLLRHCICQTLQTLCAEAMTIMRMRQEISSEEHVFALFLWQFGKGLYFADLVSKSAQYCYTTKTSPTGLLLLSEVALGDIHELKSAKYMEKPVRGSHSTKGLGKMKPLESEYEKWDDNVTVPCGSPVPSNVRSDLMYNEYIVYNTAQVRLRFLLKVSFKHKH
jgi:hypothetical protein